MEIIRKYWIFLLLGLVLRLSIAAFSYHPDVKEQALSSAVFFQEGSLNFYADSAKIAPQEILDDLPLRYLLALPIHAIGRIWVNTDIEQAFFQHTETLFGSFKLWGYLLYAKLPFIIFDMALGILLAISVSVSGKWMILFWMFNPVTLWATAAIGQFDIYPAFFMILSWYFLKKGQFKTSALSLGLGGAIKMVPFFLLPLLLGTVQSFKEKLVLLSLAMIPLILTVVPFITSVEFRRNALLAPQLNKIFFASISLSGGESIFIVLGLIIFLYLVFLSKARGHQDFLNFSLAILLLILAFTHFHIQWFLWVSAFLLIFLKDNWGNGVSIAAFGLLISLVLMLFLFDSSLQIQLFRPILPSLDQAKGLAEILSPERVIFWRSFAASIFAASSLFLIWMILKKELRR